MKIYLAGPMTGLPKLNAYEFMKAAERLRSEGHVVFNPAETETFKNNDLRNGLLEDLTWICKEAEAVAMLPKWENSKGANAERYTALCLGLQVIYL